MEPTIAEGEQFLAVPIGDHNALRAGDVVVFRDDRTGMHAKRIIALPGQRVAFDGGVPIVDGERALIVPISATQFEETLGERTYRITLVDERNVLRTTAEVTLPAGHAFLVGDGRDLSDDSRRLGSIPLTSITHRAERIVQSTDPARIEAPIR
jgi:signal peptidase I